MPLLALGTRPISHMLKAGGVGPIPGGPLLQVKLNGCMLAVGYAGFTLRDCTATLSIARALVATWFVWTLTGIGEQKTSVMDGKG